MKSNCQYGAQHFWKMISLARQLPDNVKQIIYKVFSRHPGIRRSATGVFVPPALILPRKRMNPLLYKDAPNGTLPLISDTSYIDSHLFIDWLKHCVKHAKPSTEDDVLLIADNHTSY
ncbi:hypothetical protein AVEN_40739-1 [Araneus ventricosus]|uniref:DDE-1 domain-containing protein n=1 Tax=Araneus ventricosus TaxID=182803 RepID=A0A4Y2EIL3_ARAVE|nr:hypothetical protein AVEN_40739-1 [Araneus ventricosus]